MKKRGQLSLFILIAIILVGNIVLITLLRDNSETTSNDYECLEPSDCIAAACCDATSCVANASAPDCTVVNCFLPAKPGFLIGGTCG